MLCRQERHKRQVGTLTLAALPCIPHVSEGQFVFMGKPSGPLVILCEDVIC